MRSQMASSAWSWPMTRSPRCSSSLRTVWISSLQHLADGNAGPAGDHLADDLRVDADAHERRLALQRVELRVELRRVPRAARRDRGRGCGAAPPSRRAPPARRRWRAAFELARGLRGCGSPDRFPSPSAPASRRPGCASVGLLRVRRSRPAARRGRRRALLRARARASAPRSRRSRRVQALRRPAAWRSGPAPGARRRYRARSRPCRAAGGPAM